MPTHQTREEPAAERSTQIVALSILVTAVTFSAAWVSATQGSLFQSNGNIHSTTLATVPYVSSSQVTKEIGPRIKMGIGTWFYNWYPSTIPDAYFEQDCDRAAELGAHIARTSFRWDIVEPRKGYFRWDIMDYIINTIVKRAKTREIVLLLTNTADWAVSSDAGKDYWRTPPKDIQGYKDYLTAIVQRYRDKVKYWEIWNEPNLDKYWLGTPRDYVTLLQASYEAIRAADPHAKVLGASLSGNDYQHIKLLYDLGAKPYFDMVSVHPYCNPWDPEEPGDAQMGFYPTVRKVLDIMVSYGDENKDVWFTELAWAKDWSYWGGVTAENQANYMKMSYQMANDNWQQVKTYVWFTSRDQNDGNWGLYEADGSQRPSRNAFKELAENPQLRSNLKAQSDIGRVTVMARDIVSRILEIHEHDGVVRATMSGTVGFQIQ